MCSFKFFNQNVCTVNVHEMYYKFNPGPSRACMWLSMLSWLLLALAMAEYVLHLLWINPFSSEQPQCAIDKSEWRLYFLFVFISHLYLRSEWLETKCKWKRINFLTSRITPRFGIFRQKSAWKICFPVMPACVWGEGGGAFAPSPLATALLANVVLHRERVLPYLPGTGAKCRKHTPHGSWHIQCG
jgi:hypothetical protein